MDDKRKDYPDPKRPPKTTAHNNYRPIMCLSMMWKRQMAQIRKEMYDLLISCGLFPRNRKNVASGREVQENYYTLINISSMRARQDGVDRQQKGI